MGALGLPGARPPVELPPNRELLPIHVQVRALSAVKDLCCEEIDRAVARVCHANEEVGAALAHTHLLHWPSSKIASKLKVNQRRVLNLVRIGEAAISQVLDSE